MGLIRKKLNIGFGGEIGRIFSLSWPVMVGMILQSLLGTVDMIFISRLGTAQAASASLGNSAAGVIFVMSSLVSAGTIALVSRSYGEGDMEAVRKFNGESIILSAIIGGILSIICFFNTDFIIKILYNPDRATLKLTSEYLSIIFIGTIFVFLNSALRTTLQALGDTKTPLIIFGISNIINLILDPVMMFPMGLGIKGAAIATVISTIYSFIAINYVLVKRIYNGSHNMFFKSIALKWKDTSRILKIGGWACIQQIARPITGLLMFRLVYEVGKETGTAAFGIGGQVFNYTFIFLVGLSTAIAIMVGQSLGKGDLNECDKVIKDGVKLAFINMAVFSIPYFIVPGLVMRIFTSDPGVIANGVEYLRIVYIGIIFVVYPTIYGGVFQGAGDTFPPMISSLTANVLLKLPMAYLLAKVFYMGTKGVWISIAMSVLIEAVIIVFYFKQNRWKEKII